MRASQVRRVSAVWGRPDTRTEVLARTGAILPGTSTELQALLGEVSAHRQHGYGYSAADVDDLGALWEWVERTGTRPAPNGWASAHLHHLS